ncbi:hypothetical protein A2767_04160 [Candidatus Roizmanbacteria bacterium RIFCSPHIGHO2_01_FULL_35_10]|uniref:Uncharacterized protein n=1 Tax=Candidatus Roizmanbacteria bacterium RIFCSPLOWO2_01_FULL_35_13 TaxID=1802055 RepID=A0A1F7IH84_9BACT|nr:MAG: hypothetical protein A2767_04160 [Candidatus Roizmanbacteria bacterium RIFCSPHIGHO2_01_FULL_35_10]OGK42734.1 MAG: hypothetical protein A3A74_00785 [Candidatus Roizmanbacteria bacterium RIFCSPLOWO2_01_FULL_35_13]
MVLYEDQPPPNEFVTIYEVTVKCKRRGCPWSITGKLEVESNSGYTVATSGVFKDSIDHHEDTRPKNTDGTPKRGAMSDHNRFNLLKNNKIVGFVSVGGGGPAAGLYYPISEKGK